MRKYYPSQYPALDVYSSYQWLAAEVFVQAIKNIGNAAVTRQSLVNALDGLKNYDDGGMTDADLLRAREPRPAALLPVAPEHERQVEHDVRVELLLMAG